MTILAVPLAAAERDVIPLEPDDNAVVAMDLWSVPTGGSVVQGIAVVAIDPPSGLLMATINRPGNPADGNGLGSVADTFRMTVYEITNAEYLEMLDAVAAADPNGLFNFDIMTDSDRGGLLQSGSSGSFTYSIKPEFAKILLAEPSPQRQEHLAARVARGKMSTRALYKLVHPGYVGRRRR